MICALRIWRGSLAVLPVIVVASLAVAGAPAPRPEKSGPHTPEHQIASLGNFRFESGETIDELKVSYVTYGKLNAARDNAVLSLQHFTGDHHDNEFLIGPGKAFDPGKYFVIATDFLANARSRQDLTTGPTNRPRRPSAIMPPMTPIRITGIGTSSPRPSSNGFRTLSLSPAMRVQTRKMIAGCVASFAKT